MEPTTKGRAVRSTGTGHFAKEMGPSGLHAIVTFVRCLLICQHIALTISWDSEAGLHNEIHFIFGEMEMQHGGATDGVITQ